MSTDSSLPLGEFITSLGGKRCTAVPRTDVSTQTSTTSAFSASSTLAASTSFAASTSSASQVLAPPAVQATTLLTTPPPAAVTTTSAASIAQMSITTSTSEALSNISPAAVVPQISQSSVADTSTVAASTTLVNSPLVATALPVTTSSTTPLAATPPQSQVLQTDSTSTTSATPFTTIGLASTALSTISSSSTAASTTTIEAVSNDGGRNGNGNRSTAAVAGGVIGGVAVISLVAFFIWFWRRRALKRRRSTLLTPLTTESGPYGGGWGRDSLGPPPRSNKVKTALRGQYGRIRGRIGSISRSGSVRSNASHGSARSVDLNRGNSQYMDSSPVVGREAKSPSVFEYESDMTIKERVTALWSRFRGGGRSKEPELNEKTGIFGPRAMSAGSQGRTTPKSRPLTNKPDFLTLLNMDDKELDREAIRERLSRTRGGSEGSGISGLSLNFSEDPFSDANALIAKHPKAAPLVVSGANNPFSDANAIAAPGVPPNVPPKPSTYVQDIRRSRGGSLDASTINLDKALYNPQGGPTTQAGAASTYYSSRDSQASIASFESFATKRNKFRSDPFDLEPLSAQVSNSLPNILTRPTAAHTRHISDASSKYSSGFSAAESLQDWSDPGPDVGPAGWDPSRRSSGVEAGSSTYSASVTTGKAGSGKKGYAL